MVYGEGFHVLGAVYDSGFKGQGLQTRTKGLGRVYDSRFKV